MQLPTGKYSIIYADPPWNYKRKGDGLKGHCPYPVMTMEELMRLPVHELAAPDCALFMWCTMPKLDEIFERGLFRMWGFQYKTCAFTWVKTRKDGQPHEGGLGSYTRGNAELCLLATRGKCAPWKQADVCQIIMSANRGHSCKPLETKDKIVKLFGDRPRVELFARDRTPGWDAWGNQCPMEI
jgi:N6-adenosine-specific RNA methylase IME4